MQHGVAQMTMSDLLLLLLWVHHESLLPACLPPTPAAVCCLLLQHGVAGFTRTVALEVATQGVTVNCVCPGEPAWWLGFRVNPKP